MSDACKLCRGACCESLLVPIEYDKVSKDFWDTRGRTFVMHNQGFVELENRCKHLEGCGSCGIYPNRPKACIIYKVGSHACIQTIKSRRADQAEAIIRLIK
jgi:Fe-S-cluster containining protein